MRVLLLVSLVLGVGGLVAIVIRSMTSTDPPQRFAPFEVIAWALVAVSVLVVVAFFAFWGTCVGEC